MPYIAAVVALAVISARGVAESKGGACLAGLFLASGRRCEGGQEEDNEP